MLKLQKKSTALLLLCVLVFAGCSAEQEEEKNFEVDKSFQSQSAPAKRQRSHNLTVKYRVSPVDVSNFDYLNTSRSSFVGGAWYDTDNKYMIINLNGTNYHYCDLPSSVWRQFSRADSFGRHYNSSIKGNYDCRYGRVPEY